MLIAGAPAALVDHARTERQERRAATEDDRITEHAQLVHEAELERRRGPAGASVRLVATLSSGHSSRIGSNAIHDNARTVVQPRTEHRFSWWHQGVFLFDRAYAWSDDCSEYIEAASGPWLGQSHSREVTFVSPGGAVFSSEDAPLVVEVLDEPPELSNEADSVGEFDLLVPSGELVIEESGGGGGETVLPLPPGEWRARWSGFGQTGAEAREDTEQSQDDPRPDHYLLQLWPLGLPGPAVIVRGY